LGESRSSFERTHFLQTPDTFVRAPLPGMRCATAIVHVSPAIGAGFLQYTAEMESQGILGSTREQRFVYVLEGNVSIKEGEKRHELSAGGYCYVPPERCGEIVAHTGSRVAVIEKTYQSADGIDAPDFLVHHETSVPAEALMGDSALEVRSLLPDHQKFDFAVNTMTYQPGTSLSRVESHVMEHGLLMLEGGGIYRLGDCWYPVSAGDFLWMAPFCPQWFGALGKTPAKYLIYKDWNRHPLS
jgi:(S)-ureidoglycine aminohydrolase